MKTVLAVAIWLGLMGCDYTVQVGTQADGGSGDAGSTQCLSGLSRGDWFLIQQSVHGVLQDALQVAEESAKQQAGKEVFWGALSVPGARSLWQDQLGFVDWVDPPPFCNKAIQCKQPKSWMTGIRFCMKSECGEPREVIVSTAATNPQLMTTGSDHVLSYAVDVEPPVRLDGGLSYPGERESDVRTLRYALNPSAQWHLQYSTTGGVGVTASLANSLTATDSRGQVLDLTNSAAISVQLLMAGAVPSEVTGTMSLPNVTGGALELEWHLDASNQIVGQVKRAASMVGSFRVETPRSFNVEFSRWTSACD